MSGSDKKDGYILEFVRLGDYVKVTAADPKTLREASVTLPARGLTRQYMEQAAIKRLERVIADK